MYKKTMLLMLCLLAGATFNNLKSQSLVIRMTDGTEHAALLSTVQNLTFTVNEMLLNFRNGVTDNYSLPSVRKLTFDTGTSTHGSLTENSGKLTLFPNPAGNSLTLLNAPAAPGTAYIFSTDGRLVMQSIVNAENATLDLGTLKSGLYVLILNGQSARFIRL